MKFSCSLHMVNLDYYELNRNQRDCKFFWEELFENIESADFHEIELPYEPFWESIGRNGIPFNETSLKNSYGRIAEFKEHLKKGGINNVSNLYFDPRFLASGGKTAYFDAYEANVKRAINEASELGVSDVVVTVSEEIGYLTYTAPKEKTEEAYLEEYRENTIAVLKKLVSYAAGKGVELSIKNEFWGLARGNEVDHYLSAIPELKYAPDLAHLEIANIDIDAFLEKYISRINVVVFSDTAYNGIGDFYNKPCAEYPIDGDEQRVYCDLGQGRIDFAKHYRKLVELGYDKTVVFECKQTEDYCRALLRMRKVMKSLREE